MKKFKFPLPKNKYARIFVKSMLISFSVIATLLLVLFIVAYSLFNNMRTKDIVKPVQANNTTSGNNDEIPDSDGDICKNILVFGVDKGEARTDTIMLVHFNSQTSQVAVISIPRDTKVSFSPFQEEKIQELGRVYTTPCKITDMSSYSGVENLRYFTIATIEEMLNIKVDNYVVVNTQMLRDVVDKIGGVEVNVPRAMQYYDTYQNLNIDLQPGLQTLNGAQSEGLVRWRHNRDYSEQYAEGDIGRIETQHLFLEAFAKKVLNIRSFSQLSGLITCAYNNITTDMDMSEAISYISYLNDISLNNIMFKTLPGVPVREDRSYYIVDEEEAKTYISLVFTDLSDAPSSAAPSTNTSDSNLSDTTSDTNH